MSVLLRPGIPPDQLSPLAILAADAVAAAVEDLFGLATEIKWPNDVLVHGGKLSGILIQARASGLIVGIGVNSNVEAAVLPPGAASLRAELERVVDQDALRTAILDRLAARYQALTEGAVAPYWRSVEDRLALRGASVSVVEADARVTGSLLGIDPTGALRLRLDDGRERRILSGDLIRGPRPAALPTPD